MPTNNWQDNQRTKEMGLGKEASVGEIPRWPLTSTWEGGVHMSDAYGPLHEHGES